MATGIILPQLNFKVASSSFIQITSSVESNNVQVNAPHNGPWTPPEFAKTSLTILSVNYPPFALSPEQKTGSQVNYVFDAVFRLLHRRILRKTSHPVLTGANISDHAYIEPTRVLLEIGMSDAMSSYSSSMWSGASTKSISAWQKIKSFQVNKNLITLTTRLDTYSNMMVIEAEAPDDFRTKHGLRASIVFEELLSASAISIEASSARSQSTDSNQEGTVQGTTPDPNLVEQHVLPDKLSVRQFDSKSKVPGSGSVSGTTLSQVPEGAWK